MSTKVGRVLKWLMKGVSAAITAFSIYLIAYGLLGSSNIPSIFNAAALFLLSLTAILGILGLLT